MTHKIEFSAKRKDGPEILVGDLNHIDGAVFIFPRHDGPDTTNSPDWYEVEPYNLTIKRTGEPYLPVESLTKAQITAGSHKLAIFMGAEKTDYTNMAGSVMYEFPDPVLTGFNQGQPLKTHQTGFSNYYISLDWLYDVWQKFKRLEIKGEDDTMAHSDHLQEISDAIADSIPSGFAAVVKAVTWYNIYLKRK